MLIPNLFQSALAFSLHPFLKQHGPGAPVQGLPEGILLEKLAGEAFHHFGKALVGVSHVSICGEKPDGTYRLFLRLADGDLQTLIFKNFVYRPEDHPGLAGLPVSPGAAEYSLYLRPRGSLAAYLPVVFYCQEVVPNRQYRYLLEDLSGEYRRAIGSRDMLRAVAELTSLHRAMFEWSRLSGPKHLLAFNRDFSAALQRQSRSLLESYLVRSGDKMAARMLDLWPKIVRLQTSEEFDTLQTVGPIHGNFSPEHILIHRRHPEQIKVIGWEWAGIGLSHTDLACLLKRAAPSVERRALEIFARSNPQLSLEDHWRLYRWSCMERGLFDFVSLAPRLERAPQAVGASPAKKVRAALSQVLRAHRALTA